MSGSWEVCICYIGGRRETRGGNRFRAAMWIFKNDWEMIPQHQRLLPLHTVSEMKFLQDLL